MYMSKEYYALGNLWLVWSKIIQFGKSKANKDYDRPVVTVLPTGKKTYITPGTSQRKKGKSIVKVSANKCTHLNQDTYFLARYTQPISTKELWNHLGELPNNGKSELRKRVFSILLKRYGIRLP